MIVKVIRKMNMSSLQIVKDFQTPKKVSLGRWNIEKCDKKIFTKTDRSNEDHCGTCTNNNKDIIQYSKEDDEYLRYLMI